MFQVLQELSQGVYTKGGLGHKIELLFKWEDGFMLIVAIFIYFYEFDWKGCLKIIFAYFETSDWQA